MTRPTITQVAALLRAQWKPATPAAAVKEVGMLARGTTAQSLSHITADHEASTADHEASVPGFEGEPEDFAVNLAARPDPPKAAPNVRRTRRACQDWLRSALADGPRRAVEVEAAARAAGFKKRTITRARAGVVEAVKQGTERWDWILLDRAGR